MRLRTKDDLVLRVYCLHPVDCLLALFSISLSLIFFLTHSYWTLPRSFFFLIYFLIQFVRVAPGSMLQLLWPCAAYSTDACVFCGGNFRDHLLLNWFPHLYSPFDQWLDRTFQQGSIVHSRTSTGPIRGSGGRPRAPDGVTSSKTTRTARTNHKASLPTTLPVATRTTTTQFVFHRRYVKEQGATIEDEAGQGKLKKKKRRFHDSNKNNDNDDDEMARMEWRRARNKTGISYAIRSFADGQPNNKARWKNPPQTTTPSSSPSLPLSMAWNIVLNSVEQLMRLEAMENEHPEPRSNNSQHATQPPQ